MMSFTLVDIEDIVSVERNDPGTGPSTHSVGRSPSRPDGEAKVRGRAAYVDDLFVDGMWFGATVRSPHPAARIGRVDAGPALADPDAVVLTAADLPGPNVLALITDDWPVLAAEQVRHVSEAVAIVAAPTRERARRAAAAVRVEYDLGPAVLDLDDALRGDPRTGGRLNLLAACNVDHGDIERGLAAADLIIEGTYAAGLQEHIYIEPHGVLAVPRAGGAMTLLGSLQCPYYVHSALVRLLGVDDDAVRVRQTATGGGFGGKEDYPNMIAAHAVLLARRTGHPIKLIYDRHEDIIATTKRHPARVRHRTGVMRDGALAAMDIDVLLDGGAYTTLSPVVLSRSVLHAGGAYACPNVRVRGRVLATNTPPNGAFRGFGAPQSQFAVERHMDRIARRLGVDPLRLRLRNAYRVGDTTPTGQKLRESVSAVECLEEAARRTDFGPRWSALETARRARGTAAAAATTDDVWHGIGLALFWHGAGFTGNGERLMRSPAAVRLGADGRVEVLVSSTDFGQGTVAVLAQIVADAVGVPFECVTLMPADTGLVPDSGPTVASRTVMIVGGVLERAARRMARELCEYAAARHRIQATELEIRNGELVRRGSSSSKILETFAQLAERYRAAHGSLVIQERHEPADDETFDEATYRGTAYPVYGWGCDVVEVSVDPDTLTVHPERVTMVCDVGRAIHPVLCAGQIEGGTLQALGYGYLEEMKTESGRYLNDRLATYIIPTTLDTPRMETVLIENPAPCGPFGAKGVGELPMDGGAPAIVQAIENATGIQSDTIPATPERLHVDLLAGKTVDGDTAGEEEV